MTLTQAITNSVNIIPVKLSIALGDGNPKLGRAKIIQTARNFGIYTPLPDTPSLPIGADAVNVLEHAVAFATFPNLGRAVAPHAALEVRSGTGQLIWRFDRDGKRPEQVISPQVALEMIGMMNSVVERGTGKRAQLDATRLGERPGPPTPTAMPGSSANGKFHRRGLDGQRRLYPDQTHDRRQPAGAALAQHHDLCAPEH